MSLTSFNMWVCLSTHKRGSLGVLWLFSLSCSVVTPVLNFKQVHKTRSYCWWVPWENPLRAVNLWIDTSTLNIVVTKRQSTYRNICCTITKPWLPITRRGLILSKDLLFGLKHSIFYFCLRSSTELRASGIGMTIIHPTHPTPPQWSE
jgi:hypothetical protein